MTLYERYIKGDRIEVYNDIYNLEQTAFHPDNFNQVELVLKETFKRTAYNLNIIYQELKAIDYLFVKDVKHDWQIPYLPPYPNNDELLSKLKAKISDGWFLPLSLEYFYTYVGGCNFGWDWETDPDIPWEGADPLDIPPIPALLEMAGEDDYEGDILMTGDYLQKDNISGSCYTLELPQSPSIDSVFSGYDIPFIEYLRLTFDNCGFTMADQCEYESLEAFCERTRPKLIPI
jgi:hypothetical protein